MHKMAFAHVFGSEKKNGFGPFSYKFFVCIIRVGLRNDFFLKNELFFKDPECVNSRSARPSASCIYWLYSKERD